MLFNHKMNPVFRKFHEKYFGRTECNQLQNCGRTECQELKNCSRTECNELQNCGRTEKLVQDAMEICRINMRC